jgi:regulator of protease activity HflC (stomatin/prohibitin superfamily)
MWKTIQVPVHERAVVLRHGVPIKALGPGKHFMWGGGLAEVRFKVDELTFETPAEVRAVLPSRWYVELPVGPRERGVVYRDGRPVRYLRPGVHRVWRVDPAVEARLLSVDEPVPELTDELRAIIPAAELVDITVKQHERGLKYVQGRFVQLLEPGRYVSWSHPEARVSVQVLDMRQQQLTIQGQELMTRDKVTLRLTLTAEYAPSDAPATAHSVANVRDAIYLAVQLAAREYVAGVTLDELLEARDAMTRWLEAHVRPQAQGFGVEVGRVGVKDVVLPGEMKALLNRVIEAEKEAAANVILRREEAAATRSMANTARALADSPLLLELKRLEALEKMAKSVREVRLVVGHDGVKQLLGGRFFEAAPGPGSDEAPALRARQRPARKRPSAAG